MPLSRARVLLADDHALLLGAFEKLLAADCDVVGQVSDGRALVAAAESLKPDVIVLDISMPILNGLEAGRQIKQRTRDVKLVFLTMNEDPDLAAAAFRAGASAYLLKRSASSELLDAIREAMHGRSYITPLITSGLVGSLMHGDSHAAGSELTPRQREVLQLLAEGRSMKEVASLLNLTPRTVAFHKYRMMEQLGVKSSAELVQYAVKHHIV
jgi:DNA-binding NarL/FixJ family response regulator